MIPDLLLIQVFVMGAVFWRAAHERLRWDRVGFALLGCSCALMAFRRATAPLDDFLAHDRIVLPMLVSWALAASASCFVIEMFVRLKNDKDRHKHPDYVGATRYFWPFLWFFFVSGMEFLPAQWNGSDVASLSCERSRTYALSGPNRMAAIEQVRFETARNLDALFLISSEEGPEGIVARRKLLYLVDRLENFQCRPSPQATEPPLLLPSLPR